MIVCSLKMEIIGFENVVYSDKVLALVSKHSKNKSSYGCMVFATNLFVASLLKYSRSC